MLFDILEDKNEVVFVAMMELGWEVERWAAPVNHYITHHPGKKYIIATLPDRIDLYKNYHEYYPIHIDGLYTRVRPDMFKINKMAEGELDGILQNIKNRHPNAFLCEAPIKHKRNVFNFNDCDYNFQPRPLNKKIIESIIAVEADKKIITIAPRHRTDCDKRNWPEENWHTLFRNLHRHNFLYFIAGANNAYIKPKIGGYCLDQCNINGTSTIGLVIEAMRASRLTIGQQSGNPILSLHLGTPVVSWGHEKERHSVDENPFKTPCYFFDDPDYTVDPELVFQKILEMTA